MLLSLTKIISMPGGVVPFSFSLDFSQMDFGGSFPAQEPVSVSGQVKNEAGVLLLSAELSTTLHCVCDRCAASFLRDYTQKVEAVLVTELAHEENEDDWTFLLQGDNADLEDIMTTAFVLNMDAKMLCSEDCKGLCFSCGKNLNEGKCDCTKEPDPRLAVLKQLLTD